MAAKPPKSDARQPRRPRAIRIDDDLQPKPAEATKKPARKPRSTKQIATLQPVADTAAQRSSTLDDLEIADGLMPPVPETARRRGISFGALLLAALGGLVSLGIGLAVDQLIRDLFARADWLGWLAAALAATIVLAACAIAIREALAIMRMRAIGGLRELAARARHEDNRKLALKLAGEMDRLYAGRPDTAKGRAELKQHRGEIIDGSDLVDLAERDLLGPLDASARTIVMDSAKRVSIVTAVSPRAIVDLAFVLMENLRLVRRLSQLYGGRPGFLGFMRLTRNVLMHLATTGAIAVGDSLIQQVVGHGLAARLSARLGEGVVNGLLTTRIGIAAIDVCRPMPFGAQSRPKISDFLGELVKLGGTKDQAAK